jgi:hypothetical protein
MGFVAMISGILSWWINYNFSHAAPFLIKLYLSIITLVLGIIGIAIHAINPQVAYQGSFESILYHFTVLITVPTVIIMAYYGGWIVWVNKRKKVEEKIHKEDIFQDKSNKIDKTRISA